MLIDLINDARAHGHGSSRSDIDPATPPVVHTLAPTVVLGVTDQMKMAHEEIFGPILPIFGYGTIDNAIDYVNARPDHSRSTTSATTTRTDARCSTAPRPATSPSTA